MPFHLLQNTLGLLLNTDIILVHICDIATLTSYVDYKETELFVQSMLVYHFFEGSGLFHAWQHPKRMAQGRSELLVAEWVLTIAVLLNAQSVKEHFHIVPVDELSLILF